MIKFLWVLILSSIILIVACGNPLAGSSSGFLPVAGDYPGLVPLGKRTTYAIDTNRQEYLGKNGIIFENYDLVDFFHNEYTLDGAKNYLNIESYNLAGDNGAAGVFYYFVRRKLRNKGEKVDVGADGVFDVKNDKRNLYFFKGRWFFALIYSGQGEVPDLLPIAKLIASKVPGTDWKPEGFRYLEVEGVSSKYAYVSAGNAMNFEFLPPSATTFVSSAGLEANVYVSVFNDEAEAEDVEADYKSLLRIGGNYKSSKIEILGKEYNLYQAQDEKEGLLMFARYANTIVSISHVSDELIARGIISRILTKVKSEKLD